MISNIDNLPLVLTVNDLSKALNIGINRSYELVRSNKIRKIKIGKTYRIPRDAFIEYLEKANI